MLSFLELSLGRSCSAWWTNVYVFLRLKVASEYPWRFQPQSPKWCQDDTIRNLEMVMPLILFGSL